MRSHSLLATLALLIALPAFAARNPAQTNLEAFYKGDAQAALKVKIEEMMGLYMVLPPMRHPSEKVDIKRGQIRLNLWHPIGKLSDTEIVTRAVKWFVFGRNQYSKGVRAVFSERPEIKEVLLVFHEVIRPDQKGRRKSTKKDKVKPFLAIKLTRKRFERLPMGKLRACVDAGDCRKLFSKAFDAGKFNRRYARKARQD
ncbi:MAG: hypothetical protein ACI9U2_000371 [Bradymonadia bacterium]|jgi:hypothetical protein